MFIPTLLQNASNSFFSSASIRIFTFTDAIPINPSILDVLHYTALAMECQQRGSAVGSTSYQRSAVNGQLSTVSCQRSAVNGQRPGNRPRFPSRRTRWIQMRESAGFGSWHSTRAYMSRTKSRADKADGSILCAWVMRQPVNKPPPSHPSSAPWPLPRSHPAGAR